MSQDEFTTLRDELGEITAPVLDAEKITEGLGRAMAAAASIEQVAASPANHLDGAMSKALAIEVACSDAAKDFEEAAKEFGKVQEFFTQTKSHVRKALAAAMHNSGAPDTETGTHRAGYTVPRQSLVVDSVDDLPLDCVVYKAVPDNKEIMRRLTAKPPIPVTGARLVEGEPSIRVTAKKR